MILALQTYNYKPSQKRQTSLLYCSLSKVYFYIFLFKKLERQIFEENMAFIFITYKIWFANLIGFYDCYIEDFLVRRIAKGRILFSE